MLPRPILWPLLGSLAAHAAVLLWIHLTEDPPPPPTTDDDDPTGELTTVEIDLLPPAGESDSEPPRILDIGITDGAAAATPTPARRPRDRTAASGPPVAPGAAITAPPGHSAPGDPPHRDRPIKAPSPAELARQLTPDLGPPPQRSPLAPPRSNRPPRAPRSEIRPDGKGAYRSDDLTFDATVARDGRVTFEDVSDFSIELRIPGPRTIGRHLDAWRRDPYGVSTGNPESSALDTKTDAATEPGGLMEEFEEARKRTVPIVGGRFNFDDWISRKGGVDPYFARKVAYMDRTREERSRIAAVDRDDRLREAVTTLRAHLTKVWRHRAWTPAERRHALFVLWDECAETGADNVVAAATTARATIEAFIRTELPQGTAHAFSDAELATLNRTRQSRQRFAPYR